MIWVLKEVSYILYGVDLTQELFSEFVALVKPFGSIVSVWPAVTVDLMQLFWKSIRFSGELMFTRPPLKLEESKRQHDILEKVSKLTDEGVLISREQETMTLNVTNLRKALEMQAAVKNIWQDQSIFCISIEIMTSYKNREIVTCKHFPCLIYIPEPIGCVQ